MDQSSSPASALVDIITDPSKALAAAGENTGWLWLPFALVIIVPLAMTSYYFQTVDFDWYFDRMVAASAAQGTEMPPEARQYFTPTTMTAGAIVGIAVIVPLIMAITALYLNLVNKFTTNDERGFGSWFALSAWAGVPSILASVAALIFYLVSGTNQISFEELQFFSVNALITHYPTGHPMAAIMTSITPFLFWSIGLYTVGIIQWTKRALLPSLIIAVIPTAAYIGIMVAIA